MVVTGDNQRRVAFYTSLVSWLEKKIADTTTFNNFKGINSCEIVNHIICFPWSIDYESLEHKHS